MAKTYLDIVKYMVECKFNIGGLVDKPDIIGAVFGQTEGLLGDELDLRELQKNGKIGRIEIEVSQSGAKTYGKLYLPASLDRVETCILAAAVESVDRVGPYDAQFNIEKIEDTRSEKRRKILDRAKDLMRLLMQTEIPDSKELSEIVQSDIKSSEITTYGPEKLPAGPEVGKSDEVIIVEGRADVINLLKNDIANAVAIGGASAIPKTIIKLCNEKEVTVFTDGDRGGEMILHTLMSVAEIDYVARAPDGKEVEELTRKEIIKALRTKMPIDQYMNMMKRNQSMQQGNHNYQQYQQQPQQNQGQNVQQQPQQKPAQYQYRNERQSQNRYQSNPPQAADNGEDKEIVEPEDNGLLPKIEDNDYEENVPSVEHIANPQPLQKSEAGPAPIKPASEGMVLFELSKGLDELTGTLRSRVYNVEGNSMREMPIRELITYLQEVAPNEVYGVVLDGVITQRLIELALQKNIKAIYGIRSNPMPKKHPEIIIYTKEQGKIE